MEERMVDDEYGRGIRLKKTKEGYVDVTDELAQTPQEETENEEINEEVAFEFPVLDTDEDDEDLVGLSPEEAAALRKRKEEELAKKRAEYERLCAEGEELLDAGSFHAAELKFEKALPLDDEATDASVGYWRAKTSEFTQPDVLIAEYWEPGIESLEFDLGYRATDIIREKYRNVFEKRVKELNAEEKPLAEAFERKQQRRREVLKSRVMRSTVATLIAALPTIALLVCTLLYLFKNFTVKTNEYMMPTIVLGAAFFVVFIVFILIANKWINALRMKRANESLSTTEEGARLYEIREYRDLYKALISGGTVDVDEETEESPEKDEE